MIAKVHTHKCVTCTSEEKRASRSMTRSVSSHLETAFMSQNARKHSDVLALVFYTSELH